MNDDLISRAALIHAIKQHALSKSDALAIESVPYGPFHTMYRARIRVAVPRRHVDPMTCGPDHCKLEADHD